MSVAGDIDQVMDSFCPKRRNLVDINQFECLFCFSQVAKTVIKHLNQQTDQFFFKRRFSGNYPSDYISEKSLKPFIVEPVQEFSSPEIAEIEYTLPIHGYIPEINRCWFFHENSIHFFPLKNPNTSYICYPIRQKVEKIFLFPVNKSEPENRLLFICAIIFKASIKIYPATLQNADQGKEDDFCIDIQNEISFTSHKTYTCAQHNGKGRIFFGGADQLIYELLYQVDDYKIKSCSFVDITSPALISLVPNFLYNMLESNFILEIQIDSFGNILFALDSKSNIHIYKINNLGVRISKIQTLSFSTINSQCSIFIKSQNFFHNDNIVTIHATNPSESHFIQIVAVFNTGFRVYISNEQDIDKEEITTASLTYRCVHLRQPPFDDFSAVRSIYSFHLSFETFLMCTDYGNSFRLWCMTRSLRCSGDLYQESLTIYMLEQPIELLHSIVLTSLLSPTPDLFSLCYSPKNRYSLQMQDIVKFPNIIGQINEKSVIRIVNKKPFETLMGIYQIKNYFDSDEFSSFTGRTTDVEFNISCYTILGKFSDSQEHLALSVLEDVWESSYVYEVDLIKNGIYKRTLINVAGDSNFNENRFLALHADLPELNLSAIFSSKIKRVSFIFYTILLHSCSYLMCLWDSRVYYQRDPSNWQLSLDLQDSKYIQNCVEELLVCTTRVINFYKSKLNDSSFMQLSRSLTEETLDFEQDLKLVQSLRFLILLTYQWLYIWSGIMTIDFKNFFQKSKLFDKLQTITFGDLILTRSDLTNEIIWRFLAHIRHKGSIFEFFTNNWIKDAPLFFKYDYKEVALANNQLLEALKATSMEDRNKYLTSSIQTYSKYPECLDLCWICNILVKLNYQPNAISLCLQVYAYFFKTAQTINEDDFEHVRASRIKISEIIFTVLNDSFYKYASLSDSKLWKESCEHGTDFHAKNLKFSISAALDRLEDENLSCQIFDWILNHDFSNMLIECSSMFLSDYLNDVDFNDLSVVGLKKARCLYEIYESRKNFLLASLQLFKIANARTNSYLIDNEIILLSLNERADYLHVSLAQVSLSPTSLENTTLVRNIKSKLESISIQRKINEELEIEINEKSQLNKSSNELDTLKVCQKNLLNNILTEKSILQDVVLPCQLTTSYLFLVKILGEASVDYDHLIKIWNFLFQQVLDYSTGFYDKKEKNDSIKQFQGLISEYGNVKHCFSLEKLIVDFEIRISKTNLGHLWFPEMLATLSIVSYEDYAHLIQENIYNMISQEFDDSYYFDILCYLFDTYISLSSVIMHDLSKSSFANAVKMFNEYLEGKFHRLTISNSDKRQLIAKTQSLTQIVISFYDKLIRQSSTIT